jgi:DNA-binding MurR/RpiR family transcriptional regulator
MAAEAPASVEDFFARLRGQGDRLPKRLRQCADFFAANPERVALSTVAEIAEAAEVQPSAVMRFCQELGFSGYSQMQKLFRDEYTRTWPDYATRLERLRQQGTDTPSALLAEFVEAGRASLASLTTTVSADALDRAVEILSAARILHIVGFRRAFPVANYMAYALDKMGVPAMLHDGVGKLDSRHAIRAGDVLLAITFAPFSPETVSYAEFAAGQSIPLVAITDTETSPLKKLGADVLLVREIDVGAFRALATSLSLATALAVAVGARRGRDGR